jgi:hypothetical protein
MDLQGVAQERGSIGQSHAARIRILEDGHRHAEPSTKAMNVGKAPTIY